MRHPSKKYKVGLLRARLNEFEKFDQKKFDQKEFADLIGCSVHTVVSLEADRGRKAGPLQLSRSLAWRIARATGVALHWLLDADIEAPIVNMRGRPYTQKDFEQATKRSSDKQFTRIITDDYADRFCADIRAILSNAIKKDLGHMATQRIERFLYQCRCEFEPDFELREKRWEEQAALTPAQQAARIRKRDAAPRAYEKRLEKKRARR